MKGFTPLILAATAGHEKVVEILLNHGADIEAQSERTKDTPLSLSCSGGRYEVVEILLSRGANKEHRNVSDYTHLSLAASSGYTKIIELLLAHGAEINSGTDSKLGISPLMLAAIKYVAYGSMRSGGLASFPGDDGGLPVFEDLLAEKLLQVALPAEYEAYGDRPVRHNQQQGDGHLPLRPDAHARRERGGHQEAAADAGERAPGRGEGD